MKDSDNHPKKFLQSFKFFHRNENYLCNNSLKVSRYLVLCQNVRVLTATEIDFVRRHKVNIRLRLSLKIIIIKFDFYLKIYKFENNEISKLQDLPSLHGTR